MARSIPEAEFLGRLRAIFLAEGYRDVTIGDLAARAGCSRRRFYDYAESKEGLYLFVVGQFFDELSREGERRAAQETQIGDRIRAFLSVGVEMAPALSKRSLEDLLAIPEGKALFDAHQRRRVDGVKAFVEEGIANGEFHDVSTQLVAEVMLFAVMRVREPSFQKQANISFSEALDDLSHFMRHGLSKVPAPDAQSAQVDRIRTDKSKDAVTRPAPA